MTKKDDQYYMQQCLDLAKDALASGNPPVGAVLVLDGAVIGRGTESGRTSGDITNHAEILAVRDAIGHGFGGQLHQSVMYTTHEPCIMCSYVIRHHKISEIVYGSAVAHVGGASSKFDLLTTVDVPKWGNSPKVRAGMCAREAMLLSEQFDTLIKP
ncbi:nucleoside deaminase [Taibaiella chishuiensis]|nr:nucleoside deaminase [Taibaiella chishuiensis]